MITSWHDIFSRRLWEQGPSGARGLDRDTAVDLLLALNVARKPDDLMPLRCAQLHRKAKRKRWTMTIDERWRIRFDARKGEARDVKLIGDKTTKTKSANPSAKRAADVDIVPAVHPGRLLKRELSARNLSANRLSLDIGVPSGRITDILNARRAITADTAVRLGRYLGMRAQFWCDLQSQFDIAVVERKKGREITKRVKQAGVGEKSAVD